MIYLWLVFVCSCCVKYVLSFAIRSLQINYLVILTDETLYRSSRCLSIGVIIHYMYCAGDWHWLPCLCLTWCNISPWDTSRQSEGRAPRPPPAVRSVTVAGADCWLTADWMRITWDWQIADANMLIAAGIQLIMMKCCHIYADLQHVYVNPLLRSWVMYNIVLWIDPPTFLHNQLIVAVLWDFGWRWMFMIIMQVK